jgi:hypothetical protein
MEEVTEKIGEATKQGARSHQVRSDEELKEVIETSERGAASN